MPFLPTAVRQPARHGNPMLFTVHALDVTDVIVLLAFLLGIGLYWRVGNLLIGEAPAHQIVIMELIVTFAGAWQYQDTRTAWQRRAGAEHENGN